MQKDLTVNTNINSPKTQVMLGTLDFEIFAQQKSLPKYRIEQFNQSIFNQCVNDFNEITGLPNSLREEIKKNILLSVLEPKKFSCDKNTIKIIFKTLDGNQFESVLISEKDRNTVCVSTQIGCPMGCAFCATGRLGFTRNLSVQEIIDQIMYFKRILKNPTPDQTDLIKNSEYKLPTNNDVTNIVIMGMGEPLLNLDNVLKAIDIITSNSFIGLGARNITLSTVGIVDLLPELLKEKRQFRIAFSLHSANQLIRERIIPSARYNRLDQLINIFHDYAFTQNKRISFEYIFLDGINNSVNDAYELIDLIKPFRQLAFVNIINYNRGKNDPDITKSIRIDDIRYTNYKNKSSAISEKNLENISDSKDFKSKNNRPRILSNRLIEINEFADLLKRNGINVFIRVSRGNDINGACGMLANRYLNDND
ncbi:MAG TPA: 23S rRNA (adenine(2503)-C(2))-methyltransferase RlmN [Candidatus Dojkabacteria bacterium]|nr:23S rRNA (adenine(2503)-C(2))-methyltransferase RlmN [Candidatus Dojkabacteria bacterium]